MNLLNTDTISSLLTNGKKLLAEGSDLQKQLNEIGLDWTSLTQSGGPAGKLLGLLPVAKATSSMPLVAASFGAGVVVGAAATALATPMRGDELRKLVKERLSASWQRVRGEDQTAAPTDTIDGELEPFEEKVRPSKREIEAEVLN